MDQLALQEEVEALKKYRAHCEKLLRDIGVDLRDLPDNVIAALDECAELQKATNLHSMDLHYVQEFYYNHKGELMKQRRMRDQLQAEVSSQEAQIETELSEIDTLKEFMASANRRIVSEAGLDRNIEILETKIKSLEKTQSMLNLPSNLDIDALMQDLELLNAKQAAKPHSRKY